MRGEGAGYPGRERPSAGSRGRGQEVCVPACDRQHEQVGRAWGLEAAPSEANRRSANRRSGRQDLARGASHEALCSLFTAPCRGN